MARISHFEIWKDMAVSFQILHFNKIRGYFLREMTIAWVNFDFLGISCLIKHKIRQHRMNMVKNYQKHDHNLNDLHF